MAVCTTGTTEDTADSLGKDTRSPQLVCHNNNNTTTVGINFFILFSHFTQFMEYFNTIIAITKALHISVDTLIADYDDSTDESTLKMILDDIRGMSPKQLEMLRDNIKTIKKFES